MLGQIIFSRAHSSAATPINYIRFAWSGSGVSMPTTLGGTSPTLTATATFTNNTGSSKTIIATYAANGGTTFVQDAELSITVPNGDTLVCTYSATFVAHSGDEGLTAHELLNLFNMFGYSASHVPQWSAVGFTADNAGYVEVPIGTPYSGGAITDTQVVWQVSATAPTGAATLAQIDIYDDISDSPVFTLSGLSDTWVANTLIAKVITLDVSDDT